MLAAPFIVGAIVRQSDIGAFRFVLGWARRRSTTGRRRSLFFYLTNLGIPVLLAVIAAFTARGMPCRWFLVAWMVALFIVPNVVVVSAVEFDMNKYFQIMWIAVAILAGLAARALAARGDRRACCSSAMLSPVLIADLAHALARRRARACPRRAAARWIAANTPERSVFVTDDFINSPVDLAGRLRISTFGPYVSNLGYDPAPREADTKADLLRRAGGRGRAHGDVRGDVRAVERRQPVRWRGTSTDFGSSPLFETVYDEDGVHLAVWPVVMHQGASVTAPAADGGVLVVDGSNSDGRASAELYDQASGKWKATGSMTKVRRDPIVVALPVGRVRSRAAPLRGRAGQRNEAMPLDVRRPLRPAHRAVGRDREDDVPRAGHTAALLLDGRVFVTGAASAAVGDERSAESSTRTPRAKYQATEAVSSNETRAACRPARATPWARRRS